MKKLFLAFGFQCVMVLSFAQSATQKLTTAFREFENDPQLKHAISSLYVINAKTGKVVFDKNSRVGLAPASTQKVITSVTAFEILGEEFRYKTEFGIGKKDRSVFYIIPQGDPTFGSSRWDNTKGNEILKSIVKAMPADTKELSSVTFIKEGGDESSIPDGWIWQDLANYYGAGAERLNWRENQFDIILRSGDKIGDPVVVARTEPALFEYKVTSRATSAKKGSGDNAYVYFQTNGNTGIIKGTIPVSEDRFEISGAYPSSSTQFLGELMETLRKAGITNPGVASAFNDQPKLKTSSADYDIIYSHFSPALDSIIYWFNKKSINLYGEALIKTLAYKERGFYSTDSGVVVVKKFWQQKGLDEDELNISDGSGLSPQNRVTTHAQVEILKYARSRNWYPDFYNSLPDYNGMRMKSGTIKDVKGYCGYHKAKDGTEYIFSFLVNNYNGTSSALVNKMYKLLDTLK